LDTIMSDSEDSTVTYTTVSSPYEGRSADVSPGVDGTPVMPEDPYVYVVATFQALPPLDYVPGPEEPEQAPPSPVYIPYVPEPVYLEYIPPEDDVFPAEEQPLPTATSPTAEDDADEDDEEQDEDDDDKEEEYPASADSIPPPYALRVTARISFRPQPSTLSFTKEDAEKFLAMSIPPPSPLTLLSSLLPQIPSHPLPASPPILSIPLTVEQIDPRLPCHLERVQEQDTQDIYGVMEDTQGRQTEIFQRVEALVDDSQYHYETG
nr:hypothetical protein [Tanacetum cinerariifolium]